MRGNGIDGANVYANTNVTTAPNERQNGDQILGYAIFSAIGKVSSGERDREGGDDGSVTGRIVVQLEERSGNQFVVAWNREQSFVLRIWEMEVKHFD